jgi:hypothetical protein
VTQLALHPEMRAQERRAQLGNEFLCGIRLGAEAVPQVALEALLVAAPVDEFMQLRRVVMLRRREVARVG